MIHNKCNVLTLNWMQAPELTICHTKNEKIIASFNLQHSKLACVAIQIGVSKHTPLGYASQKIKSFGLLVGTSEHLFNRKFMSLSLK